MANYNRDLDDLFRDIVNDGQTTIKEVERTVRDTFGTNEQQYDSLEEMMRKESQARQTSRAGSNRVDFSKAMTRYDYFVMSIANAHHDSRYRGHYREGHDEAVQKYMDKVEINKNNLSMVEKVLRQEINSYSKASTSDAWGKGYIDGLNFVYRILKRSQEEMMRRVYQRLKTSIRF